MKKLVTVTRKKPSAKQGFFFSACVVFAVGWIILLDAIHYQCPWLSFFHLYCPGCGGTRMMFALLHLDFYQAFRWNPLLFILFIIAIIYLIVMIVIYQKKKVFVLPSRTVWIAIIVLLLLYMVARNIPAFVYLIPTEV